MNLRPRAPAPKRKNPDVVMEPAAKKEPVIGEGSAVETVPTPESNEDLRKVIEELKRKHVKDIQKCQKEYQREIEVYEKDQKEYKKKLTKSQKEVRKLQRISEDRKKDIRDLKLDLTDTRNELEFCKEDLSIEIEALEGRMQDMAHAHIESQMAIPLDDQRVLSTMSCPICLAYYNKYKPSYVGICGHSLCQRCVETLVTKDCPSCRKWKSFLTPYKNYLAVDMIEAYTERESIAQTSFRQ